MQLPVRLQLSTMMFLQFFIWGAWYVTLGTYLGKTLSFDGADIGMAYSTLPWGAIVAPFIIGMVADRFFHAERVLGFCHILGGLFLYLASSADTPREIFWMLLLYALCYNPTLALVNAISFRQMEDPKASFPHIRVFGTVGWIAAGLLISTMKIEASATPLLIASASSLLLGVFAFFLPRTPPASKGKSVSIRDVLCLDALKLLKDRSFAVFIIGSVLICIPLTFYYAFTNLFLNELGVENAAGKMTLGQVSEFVFLLIMPIFFARLGVKKMLIIGMAAWVIRYLLFAFGNAEELLLLYYGGIILHGVCYDFFFVAGQIYVEQSAPKEIKASAQGFITLATYGVGMLIGAWASGYTVKYYETFADGNSLHNWTQIWLIPAAMAAVIILAFMLLFKEQK